MIVLVTGPLRSGTSAMAQALHRLGVSMCVSMLAPREPEWRAEWEDPPISLQAHIEFPLGKTKHSHASRARFARWTRKYFDERRVYDDGFRKNWGQPPADHIGAKCPLLLFPLRELEAEFKDELFVILMHRNEDETEASIRRAYPPFARGNAMRTNKALHSIASECDYDIQVSYKHFIESPAATMERIMESLNIEHVSGGAMDDIVMQTVAPRTEVA